jgi:hypothetical protein
MSTTLATQLTPPTVVGRGVAPRAQVQVEAARGVRHTLANQLMVLRFYAESLRGELADGPLGFDAQALVESAASVESLCERLTAITGVLADLAESGT